MILRFIGLTIAAATIAVCGTAARGSANDPIASPPHADRAAAKATATTRVAFAITAPANSATRSASLTVAAPDGTPAAATTANVDCSTTCAGWVSAPLGSRRFVAKLFDGEHGAGRMIAMGATTQLVTAQTKSIPLTFNTVVASVRLALEHRNILADPGAKAHLLIYALDAHGAVIVGSGYYLNAKNQRITIAISNSTPANTSIAPYLFDKPMPSQGASNVATITYKGRAHFDFPTFTVATPGLPSLPTGGVTLTWVPDPQNELVDLDGPLAPCLGTLSVGGYYYGGPFFAVPTGCTSKIPEPFTPDILQVTAAGTNVTYQVNPNHDTTDIAIGFGSDKGIYFAYTSGAAASQTVFGYILHPTATTAAVPAAVKRPSALSFVRANVGGLVTKAANITSVSSNLTLGNDGNLWFTGLLNGKPAIGTLPPAGAPNWGPRLYAVPNADTILSLEPGIGKTEALLYTKNNKFYVGTIRTDLSEFKTFPVLTGVSPASISLGDLLAGPFGSFYVSAAYTNSSNVITNNVYKISSTGVLSTFCSNVRTVYRLSDGTGIGFRSFANDLSAVVHVVPGADCTQVPDPPQPPNPKAEFSVFEGLYGVDSTAPDWILFSFPNGHRGGIF